MRAENMQLNLLCEQSLHNLWRKRAFRYVVQHAKTIEGEPGRLSVCMCGVGQLSPHPGQFVSVRHKLTVLEQKASSPTIASKILAPQTLTSSLPLGGSMEATIVMPIKSRAGCICYPGINKWQEMT